MEQATIFHVTHPKAGSQWVMQVLRECMPEDRFVLPQQRMAHFYGERIVPGCFYPTLYVNRDRFYDTFPVTQKLPFGLLHSRDRLVNWWNYRLWKEPFVRFVIIRDLRDTLVSLYFSLKHSHPMLNKKIAINRAFLNDCDLECGMLALMAKQIKKYQRIQESWLAEDVLVLKYEDLLEDEYGRFHQIVRYCDLDVPDEKLEEVVSRNSFQMMSGRNRGEEDVNSHYRKGTVGDWQNHFTDVMKVEFKKEFGETLIKTGYENDLNW